MYSIACISENWIFIKNELSSYEIDTTVDLLLSFREEIGGEIIRLDPYDDIFSLANDKFKLKFQWDSCFGSVVILNDKKDAKEVVSLLEHLFAKLNK